MSTPSREEMIAKKNGNKFDLFEIRYDVKLAASLIDARIRCGLTQAQVAKKLGTVQLAVARIEAGNVPPSHKMLKRLARIYGMKINPPTLCPPAKN